MKAGWRKLLGFFSMEITMYDEKPVNPVEDLLKQILDKLSGFDKRLTLLEEDKPVKIPTLI